MNFKKTGSSRWLKLQIAIICAAVAVVIVLTFFIKDAKAQLLLNNIRFLAELTFFVAVIIMLTQVVKILLSIQQNEQRLEKIAGTLEKNRSLLMQINQNSRLSENAKAIAFHDIDKQTLRDSVFEKLQQQDFEGTYELIDEIAGSTTYQRFAEQLKADADSYKDATNTERVSQVIVHIEKFFETHQWSKASGYIERLIKAEPQSEKAKQMRRSLFDKKQERKKILLTAWDDAIKREDTDRSLEILKELDLYLTPNEGLALQEAAKDVFKNKLHSLGVKFSLAVSEKAWENAFEAGQQITAEFPNSKMAEEIREKIDILRQKVQP